MLRDATPTRDISAADYRALAEIRYQIRRFLRFSENAARSAHLEPQQYQLLLMLRGLPDGVPATIGVLAERLQVRHHSAVGLVDRLEERGLVRRTQDRRDRRQVLVELTPRGEEVLHELSLSQRTELQQLGHQLLHSLATLIREPSGSESPAPPPAAAETRTPKNK